MWKYRIGLIFLLIISILTLSSFYVSISSQNSPDGQLEDNDSDILSEISVNGRYVKEDLEEENQNNSENEPEPTITATPTQAFTVTDTATPTPAKPKVSTTPNPTSTPIVTFTPTPSSPPLTNASCPVSTKACVPCHKSEQYCRYESGQEYGYLGWSCQNNNPGNILAGSTSPATDYKNTLIVNNGGVASCGVRYDSRGYKYMIFPTYEAGMISLKAYIRGVNKGQHSAYVNTTASNCPETGTFTCGNCTLQQFFCKFAGGSTYASKVANKMGGGVTTETLLSWVVDNRLDDMANAIQQTEGFFVQ